MLDDADGACKELTELAIEHWKREDEVIDDITLYVIFLNVQNPRELNLTDNIIKVSV